MFCFPHDLLFNRVVQYIPWPSAHHWFLERSTILILPFTRVQRSSACTMHFLLITVWCITWVAIIIGLSFFETLLLSPNKVFMEQKQSSGPMRKIKPWKRSVPPYTNCCGSQSTLNPLLVICNLEKAMSINCLTCGHFKTMVYLYLPNIL